MVIRGLLGLWTIAYVNVSMFNGRTNKLHPYLMVSPSTC